jgi:hypothetical protein
MKKLIKNSLWGIGLLLLTINTQANSISNSNGEIKNKPQTNETIAKIEPTESRSLKKQQKLQKFMDSRLGKWLLRKYEKKQAQTANILKTKKTTVNHFLIRIGVLLMVVGIFGLVIGVPGLLFPEVFNATADVVSRYLITGIVGTVLGFILYKLGGGKSARKRRKQNSSKTNSTTN